MNQVSNHNELDRYNISSIVSKVVLYWVEKGGNGKNHAILSCSLIKQPNGSGMSCLSRLHSSVRIVLTFGIVNMMPF